MTDIIHDMLQSAGEYALLTPEEEIELAKRVEQGDKEAKERMFRANMRLVVDIAKRYKGYGLDYEDLIQEGYLGLLKAIEKYDYRMGYKFATYATWWIRQAIIRALHNTGSLIRLPAHKIDKIIQIEAIRKKNENLSYEEIAQELGMQTEKVEELLNCRKQIVSLQTPINEGMLGDFIADDMQLEELIISELTKEQLVNTLESAYVLTEREKKALKLRFGLEDGKERTLDEVGREFNVTRERARQIIVKAINKLKRARIFRNFVG